MSHERTTTIHDGEEAGRLTAARHDQVPWRRWGPYLSERQWGTVREDYSANGDAWNYFPHDHARSRAYRWGEDGLAGFCDDQQRLCFALALWNGRDPILKERLFGLTNYEGNHGEDVKEYYFYLDSTPTHSYMKWLYKYPQRAFPYLDLVETSRRRSRTDREYELLDTGVFENDKYFDVYVEYAKVNPEDILIRVTAVNRGSTSAELHVLPTLWFRNTWRFWPGSPKPILRDVSGMRRVIAASHAELGQRWLYIQGASPLLFTENETNNARLFGTSNPSAYVKDGINDFVVHGRHDAVNEGNLGTKAAAHFDATIGPAQAEVFRFRLSNLPPEETGDPFVHFDRIFDLRLAEADEFYRSIVPRSAGADAASVVRQAMAGMLWSKQYYCFDLRKWLAEHGVDRFDLPKRRLRDDNWTHMANADVISMPDKWEYPWVAGWDLPFNAVALAGADPDFAQDQIELMLGTNYLHPSGQIPACEWNFSAVNPPVHAWAAIVTHRFGQLLNGRSDVSFLKRVFAKLLGPYTWWVNRCDRLGRNVFEGGFIGLDNVGVFDRSAVLPDGGLEQSAANVWMALFCQNMLEIGVEISTEDQTFEEVAATFVDHFLGIATAIGRVGRVGMWDEDDGFYYDVVRSPSSAGSRLKLRSVTGLLPLCATTVVEAHQSEQLTKLEDHFRQRVRREGEVLAGIHPTGEGHRGYKDRSILALVNPERLRRLLGRMLDEREFLSPFGIRFLSRVHAAHPCVMRVGGKEQWIRYRPGEQDTPLFGGNSNWQGPVWLPVNLLLIRALLQFYMFYGDTFTIECPTGSGRKMTLFEVAREIASRLTSIFLRDAEGRRPIHGTTEIFQNDPQWRDHLLFYEYFNGDNGTGLGASHKTGWTGLVATLIQLFWTLNAGELLEGDGHMNHEWAHAALETRDADQRTA